MISLREFLSDHSIGLVYQFNCFCVGIEMNIVCLYIHLNSRLL